MAKLHAEFDQDRKQVGVIRLVSAIGTEIKFYSALAKAANDTAKTNGNPDASPLLPYGDTPTGVYAVTAVVPSGPGTAYPDVHKYGDVGVIKLNPSSGDALLAKQNGRIGLLIHGGDPGGNHLLRRTNGCIRMMNSELADLIDQINQLGENLDSLEVVESEGSGNGPCDDNGTCDEGDPPPM
jgi:hypothetical protein